MNELVEHLIEEHLGDVDGVVVADGQLDAPEGWVLEKTVICNGKRIRTFKLP